ncbi:MAG TPA: SRPBCC family protein [Ferruginibacter sp.]|nr:SRPBCC family protein [Ferruginibacter sp.]
MSKRIIKIFFIVLAVLFIFITLLSLFIPSKLMVTKAVVINAQANKVYSQINDLQNWKHWQPVFMNDSAAIKFKIGATGVSDECVWGPNDSENKLIITDKKENTVFVSLVREGENDVLNTIKVLPLSDTSQVQVEWNVLIKLKWYPWEKFYGIFMEKLTGHGFEEALKSLKNYVEEN